jgi:membrane protease subunit (stomatin/prohibitin family)
MLVSYMTDAIGESKVSVLDLAGNTLEFNQIIRAKVQQKFAEIGLILTNLFIENMSVPQEVEKALDERTKLGIYEDKTDVMLKVATAEAMVDMANNPNGNSVMGAGVGIGAGVGMGGIMAEAMRGAFSQPQQGAQPKAQAGGMVCSSCGAQMQAGAKFCAECGAKYSAKFCTNCGAKVNGGKFCPECGTKL